MSEIPVRYIMPVGDAVAHEEGEECICGPDVEQLLADDRLVSVMIIHHSLDGREQDEQEPV